MRDAVAEEVAAESDSEPDLVGSGAGARRDRVS
jgi:hypothetical protein